MACGKRCASERAAATNASGRLRSCRRARNSTRQVPSVLAVRDRAPTGMPLCSSMRFTGPRATCATSRCSRGVRWKMRCASRSTRRVRAASSGPASGFSDGSIIPWVCSTVRVPARCASHAAGRVSRSRAMCTCTTSALGATRRTHESIAGDVSPAKPAPGSTKCGGNRAVRTPSRSVGSGVPSSEPVAASTTSWPASARARHWLKATVVGPPYALVPETRATICRIRMPLTPSRPRGPGRARRPGRPG